MVFWLNWANFYPPLALTLFLGKLAIKWFGAQPALLAEAKDWLSILVLCHN